MYEPLDRTGQRIGKLVYLERSEMRGKNREIMWNVRCDCGKILAVVHNKGRKSCGCARAEWNKKQKSAAKIKYANSLTELPDNSPIMRRVKFDRLNHCTRHGHAFLCANYCNCLNNQTYRAEQLASGDCFLATVEQLRFESNRFETLTRVCELVA